MPNIIKYGGWAIAVIFLIAWLRGCGGDTNTVYVEVPAKHGKFDTVFLPTPTPAPQKEYVYRYINNNDTVEVRVENPINIELLEKFEQLGANKDSLYADAIGEREYNIKQEDSLLITNNYIKAQGKVLAFQQDYTIKPQKIAVKDKETFLRLLGQVEAGAVLSEMETTQFAAKGSLMLQNRKGNIFSVGYDTEQKIWVGYGFSIFNWRK